MKLPWYMKTSFTKKTENGWIEVPPNNEVDLSITIWVHVHWIYRYYLYVKVFFKMLFGAIA